jgi:bile acid:Na+ symporter, BASS family
MSLGELLIQGSNLAIPIFVVSSTLGVGLSLTVRQILDPLRNARLVTLSLLANFVLAPAAALALWKVLGLAEPFGIGLLLCGLAAGAPFLIKLSEFSKGDMAFAVGLMVLLMVITVGYVPVVLPLVLEGTTVDPMKIAVSLVLMMLVPLAVGLGLRAGSAGLADRIRPAIGWISTVSMILVVVLTTLGHIQRVIGVVGSFAILAALVFTAVCIGLGWLLGGRETNKKGVLALGTAQRNTAVAFVVAGQNFEDPGVIVMIAVLLIIEFLTLVPFARFVAKRSRESS